MSAAKTGMHILDRAIYTKIPIVPLYYGDSNRNYFSTYYGDSNRITVTVTETISLRSIVNGKTIYNVYDASGTLSHVRDVSSNKSTDYIGKIARVTNGNVTYLHKDHLASAASGTNATGAITFYEYYTPSHCRGLFHLQMIHWIICSAIADQFQSGETLFNYAANDNQAGFTGHIKDAATGLNYMQARYYEPALGRFLSVDPVGFTPDMPFMFGRYTYVGNDPVNKTDPTGMFCVPCAIIAVAYVADKIYGAYDAAQTAKGIANGSIDPVDAAISQGTSQAAGVIAGPAGRSWRQSCAEDKEIS